jgi:hypothetical protein
MARGLIGSVTVYAPYHEQDKNVSVAARTEFGISGCAAPS